MTKEMKFEKQQMKTNFLDAVLEWLYATTIAAQAIIPFAALFDWKLLLCIPFLGLFLAQLKCYLGTLTVTITHQTIPPEHQEPHPTAE